MTIKINTNDVLILLAINAGNKLFSKGVTLDEIIAYGDEYDRTILSNEDLNKGLSQLLSIGYIEIRKSKFYTTDYYNNEKRKYCKNTFNWLNKFNEIKKLLMLHENKEFNQVMFERINEKDYDIALKTYRISH